MHSLILHPTRKYFKVEGIWTLEFLYYGLTLWVCFYLIDRLSYYHRKEMKPLLIDQVLTAVMTMMNAESMPVELA